MVHLIDVSHQTPKSCWNNFQTIRNELELSEFKLNAKNNLAIISKIDMIESDQARNIIKYFENKNIEVFPISSFSNKGIQELIWKIKQICDE